MNKPTTKKDTKRLITKRLIIVSLILLLILGAFSGFYLHNLQMDAIRKQTVFFAEFNGCTKHVPADKNYQMYLDPENIPCYQKALKVAPDQSFEFLLATILVKQGRYDEARPLFVDVAHPDAFGLLFRRRQTAEAQRMLQPGAMEEKRLSMLRSDQAHKNLLIIIARDEKEEQDFLKTHAVMSGMEITYMSDADKVTWLRMRAQHAQQQKELGKI